MDSIKDILSAILLALMFGIIVSNNLLEINEVSTPNKVYNLTDDKNLTKYLSVALNVYEIRNIRIAIRYLSPEEQVFLSTPTGFTSAVTQYKEGIYFVSLIPTTQENSIRLIGHEIVHVKQLYDKRIIYSDTSFVWEGKEVFNQIPEYKKRPWEIEALTKEDSISEIIREIIW